LVQQVAADQGAFLSGGLNPIYTTSGTAANQAMLVADALLSESEAVYDNYVVALQPMEPTKSAGMNLSS
jgi:hypothetical protein